MNALCYKIVFSKRLGTLVAVGEHTTGQGKGAGTGVRTAVFPSSSAASADNFVGLLKAAFASVALTFVTVGYATAAGPAANTLPTGYSVNSGNVAISSSATANNATMVIKQTTDKASVNWNSFSIGSGAKVDVQQNNANSVLLNRVVGNNPSQIFGQLTANGQVILINPNGVVFGKDGSVTASAFTASTFGMTDADFLAGKHKFSRNGSTAGVTVEEGASINTTGYVALIGASVDNQGVITTKGGSVVLASGEEVGLPSELTDNISVPLSGKIRLELLPSTINAMVANSGTITTDSGQVLMQAAAVSDAVASITHTGTIDTTGEQGGAVTLQADQGIIKATGKIKANSKNAKNKGGDIIIGRDEITGVLAKATNVSGAKLESLGGFVETSGEYLETKAVSVKAKDWLLDPSDITISSAADSLIAGAPGSITPNGGAGTTSYVKVDTIQNAINGGTNVTIQTTNGGNATGAGNITIANALAFKNTGATDATLSLIADNGIIQNTGATITTDLVNSTKLVNISMEAKGNYKELSAADANSKGIALNAAITTNGDVTLKGTTNNSGVASASNAIGVDIKSTAAITAKNISITGKSESSFGIQSDSVLTATGDLTLDGTSKNWVGVVTTKAATAGGALTIIGHKTTAAGYQGININSAVKGASVAITGDSVGHYGVGIGTSGSVESTVGDVTIIGTGTGNTTMGTNNNAVGVQVKGDITAKGKLSITGTKVGSGGFQGVTFSDAKTMKGDSIEITGTSNAWDAITFTNATFNATKTLKVTADSTAVGKGILFSGGSTNTFTADSYLVTAKTAVNNGIYFSGTNTFNSTSTTTDSLIDVTKTTAGGDTIFNAGTLTINSGLGKAVLQTSADPLHLGGGIRINGGSTVNTNGDVTIGSKNSSNSSTLIQGTINAQSGNLTLLGKANSATGVNAGVWMQDSAQTPSKIVGTNGANITIDGTNTSSDAGVNLSVNNSANSITTTGTSSTGAVGHISITGTSTSGDGISNAATTISNTSTNSSTGANGNITLTGTSNAGNKFGINSNGVITAAGLVKMTGAAKGTYQGVYVGAKVEGGNVDIYGTSTGGVGVDVNALVKATDTSSTASGVTITGFGGNTHNNNNQGVWVRSTGSVDSASKVSIVGTNNVATNMSTLMGTQIQGTVQASGDINLEGYSISPSSPNSGLVIQNTVTSTGGNITAKASAANSTKVALSISGAGALIASGSNKNINMVANTMDFSGAAAIDAGTSGTVNITTKDAGTAIKIGVEDNFGASIAQRLSLNQAELNKITAGKTVIGDSLNTGGISVDGVVTTANTAGNITLQTGGNIAVNKALTVAKNLTFDGTGASSAITQSEAIKATGLELLGANATHTLTNTGNQVTTLAANSKAINYVNSAALTLGAVNATTGINATGDVSIATQAGNLTISENVNTTASTATALVLNAGKSSSVGAAVGADVGGNIVVDSGKTVGVGSGGVAQLMTGSITGDTSAAGLAAPGKFRYNSDERNTNYNTALSSGVNVIYREKPTVTVNVNSVSKTYNGLTFTGGNGFTEVTPSGLKNGDALTSATATAVYGGTAQNAKNASSTPYTLSASESSAGKSALGYGVTYNSGTLTVAKKDINLDSITAAGKTYDGNNTASITAVTLKSTDLVGSETLTASAVGTFDSKNAGSRTATVTAANTTLADGTNGGLASNYNVVGSKMATATIAKKDVNLDSITAADKTYDGKNTATITRVTLKSTDLVGSETLTASAVGTFDSKNAGSRTATVTAANTTLADGTNGGLASNYNVVGSKTATNLITPKSLTAQYAANNKVFDGNTNAVVTAVLNDAIVPGDDVTFAKTSATFDTAAVGTNKTVTVSGIALGGADKSNYSLNSTTATAKANITAVPVPPPTPVVPSGTTARVKIPVGSSNPFALASAEDLADDTCTANSIENCYCEESTSSQGVDICYEPKAGAKGSVR